MKSWMIRWAIAVWNRDEAHWKRSRGGLQFGFDDSQFRNVEEHEEMRPTSGKTEKTENADDERL